MARSGVVSEDDANHIKLLEKQSIENRNNTVKAQLDLYSKCLLNVLNRVDSKDDVLKNILALINDLLLDVPEFLDAVLKLSEVDKSLPYIPFINHLDNKDNLIKSLSLYNLEILLGKVKTINDDEILIKIFSVLSYLIGESDSIINSLVFNYCRIF